MLLSIRYDAPVRCACGCRRAIVPKPDHRFRPVRYISGHSSRGTAHHVYAPRPKEIPSGLCECGCGRATAIAKDTLRSRRHFRGHPLPYLRGHSPKRTGASSHKWKGGRIIRRGYVLLYMPEHQAADVKGYVPEHRFVWEQKHGPLAPGQVLHHINGVPDDNRLANLVALTRVEHLRHHAPERRYDRAKRAAAGRVGAAARWGRRQ